MEQILLELHYNYMENTQVIDDRQYGFSKGKSGLKHLMAFYSGVTTLVDKRRATDITNLDLWKNFHCPDKKVLGEVLFNIFVSTVDNGIELTLSKSVNVTNLLLTLEWRDVIHRGLTGEACPCAPQVQQGKVQGPAYGLENTKHKYKLGEELIENREEGLGIGLGVLADGNLSMSC